MPVSSEHIEPIMKIAESCDLTAWNYSQYLDEINRSDSLGFVCINGKHSVNSYTKKNITGFIIMRLIRHLDILHGYMVFEEDLEKVSGDNGANINLQLTEAEGEILNIAVLPSAQNRGVGQKLLEYAFEVCFRYKVRQVWLEVRKNNKTAIEFYQKNNFQIIYTRKNYYRSPVEDALVMKAELPVLQ